VLVLGGGDGQNAAFLIILSLNYLVFGLSVDARGRPVMDWVLLLLY